MDPDGRPRITTSRSSWASRRNWRSWCVAAKLRRCNRDQYACNRCYDSAAVGAEVFVLCAAGPSGPTGPTGPQGAAGAPKPKQSDANRTRTCSAANCHRIEARLARSLQCSGRRIILGLWLRQHLNCIGRGSASANLLSCRADWSDGASRRKGRQGKQRRYGRDGHDWTCRCGWPMPSRCAVVIHSCGQFVTVAPIAGPIGATGPAGAKGDKGDKGDTGAAGATGPAGAARLGRKLRHLGWRLCMRPVWAGGCYCLGSAHTMPWVWGALAGGGWLTATGRFPVGLGFMQSALLELHWGFAAAGAQGDTGATGPAGPAGAPSAPQLAWSGRGRVVGWLSRKGVCAAFAGCFGSLRPAWSDGRNWRDWRERGQGRHWCQGRQRRSRCSRSSFRFNIMFTID
jgi:hypothetical protein